MIGDNDKKDETEVDDTDDELLDDEEVSEDAMPDIGGDTMIDVSGELKVEDMIASVDKDDPDEAEHKREVRKRLEELAEKRDDDLDSTFNFDLNDDL